MFVPWAGCACDDPNSPPPAAGAWLLLCPLYAKTAGISIGGGVLRKLGFNTTLDWRQGGGVDIMMAMGGFRYTLGEAVTDKREERTHKRPLADEVLILRPPGPLAERSMTGNRLQQGRALGRLPAGTQKAAKNVMRRGGSVLREERTKEWCGVADSRDARFGNVVCCLTYRHFFAPRCQARQFQGDRGGSPNPKAGGASASR